MGQVVYLWQHPRFVEQLLARRLQELEESITAVLQVAFPEGEVDEFEDVSFSREVGSFLVPLTDYCELCKEALHQLRQGRVPSYVSDFLYETKSDLNKLRTIGGGL